MRRPPGLWILLSAGVVWLSLQDVYGIRATSLIFGKTTTTTTTTTTTEAPEAAEEAEAITTELSNDPNATKPTLTGNPQLDYIWDPNLPKELNGYNLSDYPFYERVPDEIDFKCDGLHDGFYASVAHKCQVYHHCLFGVRYDFLCANYTAFDQTLFNCNFVSNVDCENSKKFWHRNDELYITKSTTTAAPPLYNFYTPPPQGSPLTASPLEAISPVQLPGLPPIQQEPIIPRRPLHSRRQPPVRARPQYDYYDEDYEELPRPKNRKRRPRPRPVYYDDYEEYEDERYERRGGGRRRPYSRRDRPTRRNKDRRKFDYDDDYSVEEDDFETGKKRNDKRRRLIDDYEYEDDRRGGRYDKRRPQNRRGGNKPSTKNKRPVDDFDYEEHDRSDRRKSKEEPRNTEVRRAINEKSEENKNTRLGKRRPPSEEYEDDLQQADEPKSYQSRRNNNRNIPAKAQDDGRPIIKPVSGTIYDRPRVAPRINLPVPKNAAEKFAYKPLGGAASTITVSSKKPEEEELKEYEDFEEYDEEPLPKLPKSRKSTSDNDNTSNIKKSNEELSTKSPLSSNNKPRIEMHRNLDSVLNNRKRPSFDDENEEKSNKSIESNKDSSKIETTTSSSSITTIESIIDAPRPLIRKFKRPFLPSRGGTPSRNLQSVGTKALAKNDTEEIFLDESKKEQTKEQGQNKNITSDTKEPTSSSNTTQEESREVKPAAVKDRGLFLTKIRTTQAPDKDIISDIKQVPVRIKVPIRVKTPILEKDPSRLNYKIVDSSTRATQQPKLTEVDILNANYDVTLNEAISPVLPIPVRSFGDYSYKRLQRPTKYVILDPVVSAGSTYYVK